MTEAEEVARQAIEGLNHIRATMEAIIASIDAIREDLTALADACDAAGQYHLGERARNLLSRL